MISARRCASGREKAASGAVGLPSPYPEMLTMPTSLARSEVCFLIDPLPGSLQCLPHEERTLSFLAHFAPNPWTKQNQTVFLNPKPETQNCMQKKNICLNISGHRSGKFLDSSQFSCHSCQFISHFTAPLPGTAAQEEILITRCNICKNIPGHGSGEFRDSSQFSCCSCQLISHFMATVPVTTAQEETLIGKSCSCDGRKA